MFFLAFIENENGATAIEYGLIATLVSLAGIIAFAATGTSIMDMYSGIDTEICAALKC